MVAEAAEVTIIIIIREIIKAVKKQEDRILIKLIHQEIVVDTATMLEVVDLEVMVVEVDVVHTIRLHNNFMYIKKTVYF